MNYSISGRTQPLLGKISSIVVAVSMVAVSFASLVSFPQVAKAVSCTQPVDIVIALDVSGSINASELASLKTAAKTMVDTWASAPGLNSSTGAVIGVTKFSGSSASVVVMSTNITTIKNAIDAVTNTGVGSGSNMVAGINGGSSQFTSGLGDRPGAPNILIVITDANETTGKTETQITTASDNANAVRIIAVDVENDPTDPTLISIAKPHLSSNVFSATSLANLIALADDIAFAACVIPSVTVTFDINGGDGGATASQTTNVATALTSNGFTRVGYTFAGWSLTTGVNAVVYTDGASYPFTASATLYAQWTAISQTLTFDSTGGTTVGPITQAFDSAVTAPADPTRTGYSFAGWTPAVPATMTLSQTLVASWTANEYTLTFDSTGGSAVLPITQAFDSAVTPPANPTRTGYTFVAWTPAVPATMTLSQTLTASWTANINTLTFNGNGFTGGATADQSIASNASATLNANGFNRTGYTFAGWNTVANGTGASYANLAVYTMGLSNATLFAQWTAVPTPPHGHNHDHRHNSDDNDRHSHKNNNHSHNHATHHR